MKPVLKVKQTLDKCAAIHRAVKEMSEKAVFIGVPAEKASREGPINNAELSYIHEFGAPAAGIPARPHLVPGIERIQDEAAKELKEAAAKALEGDESAVAAAFEKIGLAGEASVRQMFTDNDWLPLKDRTLNYKPLIRDEQGNVLKDRKGKPKRGKSRAEAGKANPLIITAELQKSHTYVVRKKS